MKRPQTIPLGDAVMSAAAMFELKFPSMLQFVEAAEEPAIRHNLGRLFQVERALSDSGDHKALFDFINQSEKLGAVHHHKVHVDGTSHR